jgi:hypothetical protein
MDGIANTRPPLVPKMVSVQQQPSYLESSDLNNAWTLVAVSGSILLLYAISRIIALQRRVRDLESRPPIDDIVMRGAIRQQVSEMVNDLEQSIRAKNNFIKEQVVTKVFTAPEQLAQVIPQPPIKIVEEEDVLPPLVTLTTAAENETPSKVGITKVSPVPESKPKRKVAKKVTPVEIS